MRGPPTRSRQYQPAQQRQRQGLVSARVRERDGSLGDPAVGSRAFFKVDTAGDSGVLECGSTCPPPSVAGSRLRFPIHCCVTVEYEEEVGEWVVLVSLSKPVCWFLLSRVVA